MVKHDRAAFPKTNGWEFFALSVSAQGTTIQDRGDKVINASLKKPCLDCHSPEAKFDFVCAKGHGCAPIPVTDQPVRVAILNALNISARTEIFAFSPKLKTFVKRKSCENVGSPNWYLPPRL
jgi:hypothetical protein